MGLLMAFHSGGRSQTQGNGRDGKEETELSHRIAAGYQGDSEESILSLWVFQIFTL